MRAVAVVPAFNEAASIGRVVNGLRGTVARVVVVDDGSTDGTAARAGAAGAEVLRHEANAGKGHAVRTGLAWALARDFTHVLLLDGDMQHLPDEAGRLLAAAGETGADAVLGERRFFREQMPASRYHANRLGSRVKVVQIPIYLRSDDGLFGRECEAVLAAMDLGVYPSFYEPWGYTPQETLAVGVPTITTDLAGFGRWAMSAGLGPADGITVLRRERVPYKEVVQSLVDAIERFLETPGNTDEMRTRCRAAAGRTAWKDLYAACVEAYEKALLAVQQRSTSGVVQFRLPRRALPSAMWRRRAA